MPPILAYCALLGMVAGRPTFATDEVPPVPRLLLPGARWLLRWRSDPDFPAWAIRRIATTDKMYAPCDWIHVPPAAVAALTAATVDAYVARAMEDASWPK